MMSMLGLVSRRAAGIILLAGAGLLGGALLLQHVGGIQPCPLCLMQRWSYLPGMVLAAMVLALELPTGRRHPRPRALLLALCGLAWLAAAGLAFYHVGIEQHWWVNSVTCAAAPLSGDNIDALRRQLLETPPIPCDDVAWSLFGLSLAAYNVMACLGLAAIALAGAAGTRTERQP